jgi:DNA-directed RNA polymerase omega subunit
MQQKNDAVIVPFGSGANTSDSPGVDSVFLLVILAGLRNRQLINGSSPRLKDVAPKRKNISIALEEIQLGLVRFTGHREREQENSASSLLAEGDKLTTTPIQ